MGRRSVTIVKLQQRKYRSLPLPLCCLAELCKSLDWMERNTKPLPKYCNMIDRTMSQIALISKSRWLKILAPSTTVNESLARWLSVCLGLPFHRQCHFSLNGRGGSFSLSFEDKHPMQLLCDLGIEVAWSILERIIKIYLSTCVYIEVLPILLEVKDHF